MSITEIEKFIKSRKKEEIIYKNHSELRILERKITKDEIFSSIHNEEILGIVIQSVDVSKIMFKRTQTQDLNLIVRIEKENLNIITAFPSDITKRTKPKHE